MRYVGLDVHKSTVRACILDEAGKRVLGRTIVCSRESLADFARSELRCDDRLVLEATTNTWAVVDALKPFVASVTVGNPLRTKAIAEAKVKSDKVDAEVLAQLLRCDYLPAVWEPDVKTRQMRQLSTHRSALVGDRTRVKNRIQSFLNQRLIKGPVKYLFSKAGLTWLKSIELEPDDRLQLDGQLRLLAATDDELRTVDRELQGRAYADEQVRLLMTLPGVSHGTAIALLSTLGDVSRFRDGDHAASYLGLAPSTRQSAEHCYHGPITKRGNANARWMLTQGVQHIATHPGPLGVFFRRLCKRKTRNVAITAVARKLVTIAYLMLKNNEPYRYAQPKRMHEKLTHLRGVAARQGRVTAGRPAAVERDLPSLLERHGLPAIRTGDDMPAGERKMLGERGLRPSVDLLHGRSP